MTFKNLLIAGITAIASAETAMPTGAPHVSYYAHQWDLINIDLFHAVFASAYNLEISGEFYKASDLTHVGKDPLLVSPKANIELGWRVAVRGQWIITIALEMFDYWLFYIQTQVDLVDAHPLRIGTSFPDFFDNYAAAVAQTDQSMCFGANFDANVIKISTKLATNFKRLDVSLLDVFQAGEEEIDFEAHSGRDIDEDGEETPAAEEDVYGAEEPYGAEDYGGEDATEDNADAEEEEETDGMTQEDFAVDAQDISVTLNFMAGNEAEISNFLNYNGFQWNLPIFNYCYNEPSYKKFFVDWFGGFNNGVLGTSVVVVPKV